jgi:hypothetical protein
MNYEINVAICRAINGASLALALATTPVFAGASAKSVMPETSVKEEGFCNWLSSKPGTFYKSKTNPYIQEFGVVGRFHYQYAFVDGKSGGKDFWYDNGGQVRRTHVGARVKFLNYFHLWGHTEMVRDRRPAGGEIEWGYANLYETQLLFNAQKAFDLNNHSKFNLGYGKAEIKLTYEVNTSSKKIKTVERSAIANKLFPNTLTGAWLDAKVGKLGYYGGVFSTAYSDEFSNWDQGECYLARASYDFTDMTGCDKAETLAALAYADHDGRADMLVDYEWAGSAAVNIRQGRANYMANLIYGENRDDVAADRRGSFWGFVFMPTYWITENDLEAVFRYQYAGADEAAGIRLNSRYVRSAGAPSQEAIPALVKGRGDEHHSTYLGLNYYFCDDHSKVMAGVEYDDLNSDGKDVYHGFTYFLAYRMYF